MGIHHIAHIKVDLDLVWQDHLDCIRQRGEKLNESHSGDQGSGSAFRRDGLQDLVARHQTVFVRE